VQITAAKNYEQKNTATLDMYNLDSEIQNYVAWCLEDRRRIEDKQKQQ
jgi:hypothetical protein